MQGESAWSPLVLCEALAEKRGYHLARTGRPDAHRAGREMLAVQEAMFVCVSVVHLCCVDTIWMHVCVCVCASGLCGWGVSAAVHASSIASTVTSMVSRVAVSLLLQLGV